MERRTKLVEARARKHWTLEQAAEHIGCTPNTLDRWELGVMKPSAFNQARLGEVYGMTAEELGFEDDEIMTLTKRPKHVQSLLNADFTTCLQDLALAVNCKPQIVQETIGHALKEFSTMNTGHEAVLTRRDALRRLAMFPILLSSGGIRQPVERILNVCAAGITACEHLCKGDHDDMSLAFSILDVYLPALKAIVKESSAYRKDAARLVAQAYLLRHVLGLHIESPDRAIAKGYAKLAVVYSEQSNDPLLHIMTLRNLTWAYNHVKNYPLALRTIEQAKNLVEHHPVPFPSSVSSRVYSTLAVIQAKNGIQTASTLSQAQDAFLSPSAEEFGLVSVDFGYAQLMRDNGLTHYYQGEHEDALQAFAQVIDSNDLTPKVSMPVRTYVELLNSQTMAALKSPKRDMDQVIKYWKAGMQGSITLQSQQRFDEAYMAYEVMTGVWSGERRIKDLREHIVHW